MIVEHVAAYAAVRLAHDREMGDPVVGVDATCTAVPRMPMVATGVSTFMSPVWATLPATKPIDPWTSVSSDELLVLVRVVDHVVEHHPRVGGELNAVPSRK